MFGIEVGGWWAPEPGASAVGTRPVVRLHGCRVGAASSPLPPIVPLLPDAQAGAVGPPPALHELSADGRWQPRGRTARLLLGQSPIDARTRSVRSGQVWSGLVRSEASRSVTHGHEKSNLSTQETSEPCLGQKEYTCMDKVGSVGRRKSASAGAQSCGSRQPAGACCQRGSLST